MENSHKSSTPQASLEQLENEVAYFEKAMEGIKTSYAIISSLHQHMQNQIVELTPEREEVI